MDRDTERLRHMREALGAFPFEFVRMHGLTPDEAGKYGLKGHSPLRSLIANRRRLLPGQIGCTYSHLNVYHEILRRNLPAALVFEDDVVLDAAFADRVTEVLAVVKPDVPQFYLFSAVGVDEGDGTTREIRRLKHAWGADAYLITREGARLLIAKNEPVLVIGDTLKRFARHFGLELFRVYPISARQDERYGTNLKLAPKLPGFVRAFFAVVDWVLIKTCGR